MGHRYRHGVVAPVQGRVIHGEAPVRVGHYTPALVGSRQHAVTGRFTRPSEGREPRGFPASDRVAGNITGAVFPVDGGYSTETH
jgi:NAD(P)-dependent dehydrogenase (short-subunit alcohol dehydrogenase family)